MGNGYQPDGVRQQFTKYERDAETNLDYAQGRYYANLQGRFTVIDPLQTIAALIEPQSWNRYSYVGNRPLAVTDPSGLLWLFNSKQKEYKWVEQLTEQDKASGWEVVTNFTFYAGPEWGYITLNPLRNEWRGGFESSQNAEQSVRTMLLETDPPGDYDNTSGSDEVGIYVGGITGIGKAVLRRVLAGAARELGIGAAEEGVTLYRGVNESHVAFDEALQGVAKPNKRWWQIWKSSATPLEHNAVSTMSSPYTSWTTDPAVALNYALRPNGGGVVMKAFVPISKTVTSPNLKSVSLVQGGGVVSEAEVLVKGVVSGAKVTKVP